MRASNVLPDQFTAPMVVSTCAELGLMQDGRIIHGLASKVNLFEGNSAVGSSFVYMYMKCGAVEDARMLFDEIVVRDVVAWTSLVIGYVENGESEKGLECLCEMHKIGGEDERPNFRTLGGGFQACGNLGALFEGRCLHGLALKSGFGCSHTVQSSLLCMYSNCGTLKEASFAFSEVVEKDLFSWTSIISVYAKLDRVHKCIDMFLKMQDDSICPDGMLISCILSALGNSFRVSEGKAFHCLILRRNFNVSHMVENSLLSMYCKFGHLVLAERQFDGLKEREKGSWNMMVVGFGKEGLSVKCINLFREMQYLGIESDISSLVSVIATCSQLKEIHLGQSLHCHTIKSLVHENVSVSNSLIDMYGKAGNLNVAWKIFVGINKDIVTWNTLISCYTHRKDFSKVFSFFDKMILEGYKPNTATLVTLLSACSQSSSLEKGEKIHDYIKLVGFEHNTSLSTALSDMYAKCGQLTKSREVFNSINKKDIISWNVMISGYGMHGDAKSALEIFKQMEKLEVRPNELTFLAALSACAHAGFVEEGKSLLCKMNDYSLQPTLKHYACMVDLLSRCGNLDDAEALVLSMPIVPDAAIWGSILSACKIHNEIEVGIRIAKHAIESDPENDGYYVAISDLYSSLGMWEEVEMVRELIKSRKVRKKVGWSAV